MKINERKWIEFGKMWEKMAEMNEFSFGVNFHPVRYEHEGIDYNKSPYDILKEIYFEKYLKIQDSEILELDIEESVLKKYCEYADDCNITLDEAIIIAINDFLKK